MNIEFLDKFANDLESIQDEKNRLRVATAIKNVETSPSLYHIRNLKKLKGASTFFRIGSVITGSVSDWRLEPLYSCDVFQEKRFTENFLKYRGYPRTSEF